jgi:hypothetical protein
MDRWDFLLCSINSKGLWEMSSRLASGSRAWITVRPVRVNQQAWKEETEVLAFILCLMYKTTTPSENWHDSFV